MTQRSFVNFGLVANQGNYLIVSHKNLGLASGGAVDAIRAYRASSAGGSFNAKIYDIDELVDQFAFGIKKHPLSVKNFVRYANQYFTTRPSHIFMVGKGTTYEDYRYNESTPYIEQLDLIPTFGWPASDALLVSPGVDPLPSLMVGRLSAITPTEVSTYLQKLTEYESQQANTVQTLANKLWMKQVLHVPGLNDPGLINYFIQSLQTLQTTIVDTFYGANVTAFKDGSAASLDLMTQMMNNGASLLTYYGHAASTTLDYNLNDPNTFSNTQKYPVFLVMGCNAGNFFDYDPSRLNNITSLSEKYVLTSGKGSIGFIAGSNFGITGYLDTYAQGLYRSLDLTAYHNYVGKNMLDAIANLQINFNFNTDFYGRIHAEQFLLHGDPAIKLNQYNKPDFVIEDAQVSINPNIISVANSTFNVKAYIYNIGKAIGIPIAPNGDSVSVLVKWQHGDGSTSILLSKYIKPSIRYMDSVSIDVPIVGSRDKGNNCITITIDNLNQYDELSESNNTVNKCFYIFDNDLRPVYPYNFSIINKNTSKLTASTASPLAANANYVMEMDTTELFNSAFKITRNANNAVGGIVEFDPQIIYKDSTVYYWRVATVPTSGSYIWNTSSFVYLNGTDVGFNQSHLYQHFKSTFNRIGLDSVSRQWKFNADSNTVTVKNGVYPYSSGNSDFSTAINGNYVSQTACVGHSVIFTVIDPVRVQPYYNQPVPSIVLQPGGASGKFMGSDTVCSTITQANFEFSYLDTTGRRLARDFMDWIPNGAIVTMRVVLAPINGSLGNNPFASVWQSDASVYGTGNTFYDRLKTGAGFSALDQYSYPRTWVFIYQKNNTSFTPQWNFSHDSTDASVVTKIVFGTDTLGYITSPQFGPAKTWKQLKWRGSSLETASGDVATVDVIGIDNNGNQTMLYPGLGQQDYSLTSVNAAQYPYLQLRMRNADSVHLTPYQLRYWRLIGDMVPEGAIAPNIKYNFSKDTFQVGESANLSIAFKNVSDWDFTDSITVRVQVLDKNNVLSTIGTVKLRTLASGTTDTLNFSFSTANFVGSNTLSVEWNPSNLLPEQYHFNNLLYKGFYVTGDKTNPLIDVTFDGTHILNGDIVSAKPAIKVRLKDESRYLALDDTSLVSVQLTFPNGSTRKYAFGTDTLKFTPANLNTGDNSAIVDFLPTLPDDGQYQLHVKGKDKSGNSAGTQEYNVLFDVYNKPMISDVFNYPNPFTSSTAFVFTLTGTQLPSNIRIQIMTVTGKIVREINKDELGPIHIGRNLTDFKWDGTDQYGQKLGNGVYLYRVITNLNGNSLDRFQLTDGNGDNINTNQYFKAGYGKMYLMR
jgi:hypothetical protein